MSKNDVRDVKSTLEALECVIKSIADIRLSEIRNRSIKDTNAVKLSIDNDFEKDKEVDKDDICLNLNLYDYHGFMTRITTFRISRIRENIPDEQFQSIMAYFKPDVSKTMLLNVDTSKRMQSDADDHRGMCSAIISALEGAFPDFVMPELEDGERVKIAIDLSCQTKFKLSCRTHQMRHNRRVR